MEQIMTIPTIRSMYYTDDGCTLYQCLNCQAQIETRNLVAKYQTNELLWKFCPYCGIEFESYMPEKDQREKYWDDPRARTDRITPCKFKIQENVLI
jgi:DNA-directed RNA polymerase subunit RPC12/RpoP